MIIWLESRLVLAIHDRQLAEHGGSAGVRDANLLESTLGRPRQLHTRGDPPPDLADLAASLAFGLARNHPFVDGNKRTAFVSCRTFLALNGANLVASDEEKYLTFLALGEGRLSVADLAARLRPRLQTDTPDRMQQPPARYRARGRRWPAFLTGGSSAGRRPRVFGPVEA